MGKNEKCSTRLLINKIAIYYYNTDWKQRKCFRLLFLIIKYLIIYFSPFSVTAETPRVNFCFTSGIFALLNKTSHYQILFTPLLWLISFHHFGPVRHWCYDFVGLRFRTLFYGSKVWREIDVQHVQWAICRYSKKEFKLLSNGITYRANVFFFSYVWLNTSLLYFFQNLSSCAGIA